MITPSSVEALKTKLDIVDVVGGYITLKKSGLNFSACCPFHGEKTPSVVVSSKKQIYHCFGCGVSGDAIKFVQEYERIGFNEAVEKLANSFGVVLDYDNKPTERINTKVLEQFSEYFRANLTKNSFAKEYLSKRNISLESIEKFSIGWAGGTKEQLDFANATHLNMPELIELGVFAQGDSGLYARFSDRLIFPIKNANGKVIGFGGRTLSNHPAKYINSPQTKLFNKSEVLYAYDIAKEAVSKQKELILCEGYMDAIAYHQSGFTNAAAVLGTALTQKHLPQIKRFDAKVLLSFDGDSAGQNAAFKSANLLIQNDVLGSVVNFDGGLDPADLINKRDEIAAKLRQTSSLYEFILKTEAKAYDLNDTQQKARAAKRISEVLNSFGEIAASEYKSYASALIGINEIKLSRAKPNFVPQKQFSIDFKEASIIRAMSESHTMHEYGVTRLAPEFFKTYRSAYEAILNNEEDSFELLKALSFEEVALIDADMFYDYANSLKRDFLQFVSKYFKEVVQFDGKAELLRQIAKECAKNSKVDDDFVEDMLHKYKEITK